MSAARQLVRTPLLARRLDPPSQPAVSPPPATHDHAVHDLAVAFAQLFCEVECGRRPRSLLRPLLTPTLYDQLGPVWVRQGPLGQVLRVRETSVTPDRVEAVAVVQRGERVGALALRMVRTQDGWRVDDVALPELGRLPPPPPASAALAADDPDAASLNPYERDATHPLDLRRWRPDDKAG